MWKEGSAMLLSAMRLKTLQRLNDWLVHFVSSIWTVPTEALLDISTDAVA